MSLNGENKMAIQVYDNITKPIIEALAAKINAICQGLKVKVDRQMTAGEEGVVVYINNISEEEVNKSEARRLYERTYAFGVTLYNQNSSDKTYVDSDFFDTIFGQLDSIIFEFQGVKHELFIQSKQGSSETYPCLIILRPHPLLVGKKSLMSEYDDGLAEMIFIEEILDN